MLSRLKKDEWIIAVRKRGEEQFRVIPNTLRYWCADPFVKDIDGHTFILFEMYDRLKGKGLIGYRKFDGIKWGKPKVLIEDATHLSYPFVYEENGKMYIMPESNRAGHLYRVELSLTDGELTISNKTVLKTGRYADTTRLEFVRKTYYFTTPIIKDNVSELKIYCDGFESDVKIDSRIDSTNARMGGRVHYRWRQCLSSIARLRRRLRQSVEFLKMPHYRRYVYGGADTEVNGTRRIFEYVNEIRRHTYL